MAFRARDSSQTTNPTADRIMPGGFTGGGEGSRHPGGGGAPNPTSARARAARHANTVGGAIGIRSATPNTMPPWERLARISRREVNDEQRRPHRPPFPKVPMGWTVQHAPGTSYFTMHKRISGSDPRGGVSVAGGVADEELRIFASGEIKEPEFTFRADDGEREEPEHLNWCVFISKPFKGQKSTFMPGGGLRRDIGGEGDASSSSGNGKNEIGAFNGGGLEVSLTTIDHELILDSIAVHDTAEKLEMAWRARIHGPELMFKRDRHYRGPYIGELDEEFVDEILNYLDERGINNSFAEFMQAQWHWLEQVEYEEWLRMLMAFSTPKHKTSASSPLSSTEASGEEASAAAADSASAEAPKSQPEHGSTSIAAEGKDSSTKA